MQHPECTPLQGRQRGAAWSEWNSPHWCLLRAKLAAVVSLICLQLSAAAQTHILESSALRLEVETDNYTYRLIDIATGDALVEQNQTSFNIGGIERAVLSASLQSATANSLTVNLNLAGGGAATSTFSFDRPDVLQVDLSNAVATQVREAFVDRGEHYYGLLEYPFAGAIDNRGLNRDMIGFKQQPGTNFANARAPYYVTDAGYGVYTRSTALGRYQVAIGGQTSVQFDEPQMQYFVMSGTPKQVAQTYAEIAGGPFLPPDWALGTSWWRDDHHNDLGGSVTNAQSLALRDAAMLQQHQIPAASMWIDRPWTTGSSGWGGVDSQGNFIWDDEGNATGNGFPDPDALIERLNDTYGIELMLWVANRTDFDDAWLDNAPAGVDTFAEAFDMRDPLAVEWVKQSLGTLADRGIRGFKIDRGEEDEVPDAFENLNTLLFSQAVHEMFLEQGVNDAYPFARSVYDTARQWVGVWNGDTRTNFSGLDVSLKNMVRSASMNFSVWGSDTGGYSASQLPTKTLYARWMGFSAYSPIMETMLGPNRTIWDDYDQEMIDITREHAETHHELIPYVRTYLHQAQTKGLGVVRPMVFEYPNDPNVKDMYDQYMYGDALLVAPVITDAPNRTVYLPAGDEWLDYNDKVTVHQGGQTLQLNNVPLIEVPVFVRRGSIVVRGDILRGNNTWTPNWAPSLDVEIYLPNDTAANSFEYYTGTGLETIQYSKTPGYVDASFNDLGIDGVVSFYLDDLTRTLAKAGLLNVARNGSLVGDFQFHESTNSLEVPYTGATELELSPSGGLLVLHVNRATGASWIENIGVAGVEIDGYRILSDRGSLVVDKWSSLADRDIDAWSEANPSQNMLAELNQSGASVFDVAADLSLGDFFTPNHSAFGIDDGEDLVFEYTTTAGHVIQSLVQYTGTSLKPSNLLLTVDPTTGQTRLTNTSQFTVEIEGYRLLSGSGSLDVAGWLSLEDQMIGSWQEANPSSHQLVELEQTSALVLQAGDSYELGAAFSTEGSQDIALEFLLAGAEAPMDGVVVYTLRGDFDVDGDVDGKDFLRWQRGGSPNPFSSADLADWQANYGAASPPASSVTVPEPITFLLITLAGLANTLSRQRRRRVSPRHLFDPKAPAAGS